MGLWESPLIPPGRLTIAGLARPHGYRTVCVGKWHLGWDWGISPEERKQLEVQLVRLAELVKIEADHEALKTAISAVDGLARPFVERIMDRATGKAAVGHGMEDF